MSEQDNKPEDGQANQPVESPTPEAAPEPVQAEHVELEAETAEHTADADHAGATETPAEAVPESSNAPVHDAVPESSNAPVDHAEPEADHHDAEAADHVEPEPVAPVDLEPVDSPVEPEPAAEAEPTPVVDPEPVEAPVAPEPVQSEAAPETSEETSDGIDPAVVAAGAVAAGAVVAGAVASSRASDMGSRPIWSDQGDAPFEGSDTERDTRSSARRGKPERAQRESGGFFAELFDIVRTVIYALIIAMVVRVFFFQPFTIPSASMEPNLYEGDYIVVSKWSYGYSRHSMPYSPALFEGRILSRTAERGDIVVFKRPNNDGQGYTDYIKRIIGLPGDTVQMIANRLYINGEQVQDVVVEAAQVRGAFQGQTPIQLRETLPGGHEFRIQDFGPGSPSDDTDAFTIPDGHYFVMGDNRDDSMDSRYVWEAGGVGLVPHENLVGKAQVILFSWTPGAELLNPVSWFTHVRPERFFTDLE